MRIRGTMIACFSFVCVILFIFTACGGGTHQSANWQVSVKSAKYEKGFTIGAQKSDGFVVRMDIRYLGKPGKVVLPEVYLLSDKGKIFASAIHSDNKFTNKMISLLVLDQQKYDLKKGELICGDSASFFYDIQKESKLSLKLVVGDIPPFSVGSSGI